MARGVGVVTARLGGQVAFIFLGGFFLLFSPSAFLAAEDGERNAANADRRVELAQNELVRNQSVERRRRSKTKQRKASGRKPAEERELSPAREDAPAPKVPGPKTSLDRTRLEPAKPDPVKTDQAKLDAEKPGAIPAPVADPKAEIKDAWTDQEIIGALTACLKVLGPIVAEIEPAPPVRAGQCGDAAPVILRRIGAAPGVELRPPAMVNCEMVAHIHDWIETVVQPAAREVFGAPVTQIENMSGYDCRFRNNAPAGKLSEHARANALDIGAFVTANKRKVDVLTYWGPTARDLEAKAAAEAARLAAKKTELAGDAEKNAPEEANKEPPARGKREQGARKGEAVTERESGESESKDGRKKRARGRRGEPPPIEAAPVEEAVAAPKGKTKRERDRRREELDAKTDSAEKTAKREGGRRETLPLPQAPNTGAATMTRERAFLTRAHKGACGVFTTVLGPEANEYHRNHFHVDLAPRKRKAFCE